MTSSRVVSPEDAVLKVVFPADREELHMGRYYNSDHAYICIEFPVPISMCRHTSAVMKEGISTELWTISAIEMIHTVIHTYQESKTRTAMIGEWPTEERCRVFRVVMPVPKTATLDADQTLFEDIAVELEEALVRSIRQYQVNPNVMLYGD